VPAAIAAFTGLAFVARSALATPSSILVTVCPEEPRAAWTGAESMTAAISALALDGIQDHWVYPRRFGPVLQLSDHPHNQLNSAMLRR
jgi:hypothetical protein